MEKLHLTTLPFMDIYKQAPLFLVLHRPPYIARQNLTPPWLSNLLWTRKIKIPLPYICLFIQAYCSLFIVHLSWNKSYRNIQLPSCRGLIGWLNMHYSNVISTLEMHGFEPVQDFYPTLFLLYKSWIGRKFSSDCVSRPHCMVVDNLKLRPWHYGGQFGRVEIVLLLTEGD